ncbi:MAG: GyrI-like domain-containing protein [Fibrobacterota bacterium]
MLVKIAAGIGIVLSLMLITAGYFGAFSKVTLKKENRGPFRIAYKDHTGAYSKIGPVMDSVYEELKRNGIETTKGFGLYFDNPAETPKEELRSIGGCIIPDSAVSLPNGIKTDVFPEAQSIVSEFPYKGGLSIIFGVMKVYPELSAYMKENNIEGLPIAEIYDTPGEKIEYMIPAGAGTDTLEAFLK